MISLIITDYHTINETIEYIFLYKKAVKMKSNLIVVDNSPERCGKEYLKERNILYEEQIFNGMPLYTFSIDKELILLVEVGENIGYARGNNIGADISNALFDDDYLLFSNNDIRFNEHFDMAKMIEVIVSDETIGIIGPAMISPNGNKQNPRIDKGFLSQMILGDFNSLWFRGKFNKWVWNVDLDAGPKVTGWVSGGFMLVRKKAFFDVSGFDKNTFLYAEEMIISERMRLKGYLTYYFPEVTVLHYHRGAELNYENLKQGHKSKRYYFEAYKNIPKFLLRISDITFHIAIFVRKFYKKWKGERLPNNE